MFHVQSLLARVRVNRFFSSNFHGLFVILTSTFHLMHIQEHLPTRSCNKVNVDHDVLLLLFQFCDVATLAINHKRNEPNLVTAWVRKVEKFKNPNIFWWPVGRTHCHQLQKKIPPWDLVTLAHFLQRILFFATTKWHLVMTIVGWFSLFQRRNQWVGAGHIWTLLDWRFSESSKIWVLTC